MQYYSLKTNVAFFFSSCNPLLSIQALRENNVGLENVRICYSPFSRTTHTAKVVASVLDIPFEGPQCKVSLLVVLTAGEEHDLCCISPRLVEKHGCRYP